MSKKAALYGRACTQEQNLNNQKEKLTMWAELRGYDYDLYTERVTSVSERPNFEEIMKNLEEYDLVVVTNLDKFGKSVIDLFEKIREIRKNGANFISIEQPINTEDDIYGDFLLQFLSVMADFEKSVTRRRMERGYSEAKEEGKVGRPKKTIDEDKLRDMYKDGASYEYLADHFDCSKSTVRNRLKSLNLIGDR